MDDFYFSVNLEGGRTLCLAPLTERRLAMSGQEVPDRSGYFLFETHGSGERSNIEIIAHVLSDEAAFRLRDMFRMS